MNLVDRLIARAKRTPYFHLAGYMNRYWLVPYVSAGSSHADGCGPVSPWRRPLAWLLQKLDVAVRVHEILRSDSAEHPHDHPWGFMTIVLRGGYYENRYDADGQFVSRRWHGPGSILFRRAADLHHLELPISDHCAERMAYGYHVDMNDPVNFRPATTLFITFRKQQKWGFKTPAGKVPHNEYRRPA